MGDSKKAVDYYRKALEIDREETGNWYKHYGDEETGKNTKDKKVTDPDLIDWLNELEEKLLEKEKEYQDTHSDGEESGESGSGGENVPPQPNQPF